MAQEIKTITSESLEAAYRALTPSQAGFTQDLMASNTIIPVLDLTASASGGSVPEYQAQAIAFGSQTAFDISTASVALANTAGFWRVIGTATVNVQTGGSDRRAGFTMSDGLSTKTVWQVHFKQGSAANGVAVPFDLVFFLPTGITLNGITTADAVTLISGSYRQVADVNGTVVNPSGFTPQ